MVRVWAQAGRPIMYAVEAKNYDISQIYEVLVSRLEWSSGWEEKAIRLKWVDWLMFFLHTIA